MEHRAKTMAQIKPRNCGLRISDCGFWERATKTLIFIFAFSISKSEIPNSKSDESPKRYDLEERTFLFAKRTRDFVTKLPRTVRNMEEAKQLIRASGSAGENYIEANESLGKKDFLMRIRICRRKPRSRAFFCDWVPMGMMR